MAQWYLGTILAPTIYKCILKFKTETSTLELKDKIFMGDYMYEKFIRNLTGKIFF